MTIPTRPIFELNLMKHAGLSQPEARIASHIDSSHHLVIYVRSCTGYSLQECIDRLVWSFGQRDRDDMTMASLNHLFCEFHRLNKQIPAGVAS